MGTATNLGVSEVWAQCEFKYAAFVIGLTRLLFSIPFVHVRSFSCLLNIHAHLAKDFIVCLE